ncbi:17841_t:CDS:2, partial [Funneliformis caledonium]
ISEVEAYRILGTGSSSIIFKAYTSENIWVVLKYSLDNHYLECEVQMLKKFEKLKSIPKLLYEDLHNPIMSIPCIVTSMIGKKITKVYVIIACNIIADVIEILKALHKYGYIHNDIHFGNIPEGHVIFASHNRGKYLRAGDDLKSLCYIIAFMYDLNKAYWNTVIKDSYQAIHMKERKLTYLFDGLLLNLFLETARTCSQLKKHLQETLQESSNHNRHRIEQQVW